MVGKSIKEKFCSACGARVKTDNVSGLCGKHYKQPGTGNGIPKTERVDARRFEL